MQSTYTYTDFIDIFENAQKRIEALQTIPEDLFTLKPDQKSWSAAEICSHIAQFNSLYIESIEKAYSNSAVKGNGNEEFKPGTLFRLYAKNLEPPYKVKLKTLRPFYPLKNELEQQDAIGSLQETEASLNDYLQSFKKKEINLDKTTGQNPILPFIKMSITDFLVLVDVHQRRHIWQLEQTLLKLSGNSYKPE